jgi:2-phosphosulfolactate phosphatase
MPDVRVVLLPALLKPEDLAGRAVAVFDVLRATTSIATALHYGAASVRLLPSIDAVRNVAAAAPGEQLTAGEQSCLKPQDFDLGNSPNTFATDNVKNRQILMATTNGTRALLAAVAAKRLFAGALINAAATARALAATNLPVTLLCAGTGETIAIEDVLGCGAVLAALPAARTSNDSAEIARRVWKDCHSADALLTALENSLGGKNIRAAGLGEDILWCARLSDFDTAVQVEQIGEKLVASQWPG